MANVKILKHGETNINSTDIWRFAFHSDYSTFKIHLSDSIDAVMLSGTNSVSKTITHSLGYKPHVIVNILKGGKLYEAYGNTGCGVVATSLGNIPALAFVSMSTTQLFVDIALASAAATVTSDETFTIEYLIQLDEL